MASLLGDRPLTRRAFHLTAVILFFFAAAGSAVAKTYTADRFDSLIQVLPGGAIDVTETVIFRFEDGTFSYVFRELPTRRTDGIEIIAARMDERALPFGKEQDQVEVRRGDPIRVTWRFAPTSGATHTFTLRYVVRGVVRKQNGQDVLRWRALPGEHAYAIASSTIYVASPVAVAGAPDLDTRRVEDASATVDGQRIRVTARDIGRNGWIEIAARFPGTAIIAEPPLWQQRQLRAEELAPRWTMAAIAVGLAGLILLVGIRQRYDAPQREALAATVIDAPDQLPPAIAGAVTSNGRVALQHAIAALVSLADRGQLAIAEGTRRLGQRTFTVSRAGQTGNLAPHERTLLDIIFVRIDDSVEFSKARSRLARHFRSFRHAIENELTAAGLIDPERQRIHRLYGRVSLAMIFLGIALMIGAATLVGEYGPWPLSIPGAVIVAAVIGFIFQGATTPLSNEGIRRRERWLAYQRHLHEVARCKSHLRVDSPAHMLPIAVALGLASAWSKLIKRYPTATPAWFHSLSKAGDDGSFSAFIAAGAVHGHAGGVAGGAAGGGASGAG
jgi:predicted membrane protein DUF2207